MASGEIIGALRVIKQRGYEITGEPSKILRATGYDGSWSSFLGEIPEGCIRRATEGNNRFTIIHPDKPVITEMEYQLELDVGKWTDFAVNYVLGDESQEEILDFQGIYGEHIPVIGVLACKIDDSITAKFYPPLTESPLEIYGGERSLYFISGDSRYSIVGCCALQESNNTD